jgi:DNA polymerase-3 subunit alpha
LGIKKEELMSWEFIHLHAHMSHSILDGLGTPARWVKEAKGKGMSALAVTDHASVSACVEFVKAAKEEEIKPIVGCEFYFVKDSLEKKKGRNHVTVISKNWNGLCSLMKQLTKANLPEQFYYKPRLGIDDLFNFEDCIIMTGCAVGILSRPDAVDLCGNLHDQYGEDFYIEIMPHKDEMQYKANTVAYSIASTMNIPLVATNDCHYPLDEDKMNHEILLAVQTHSKWSSDKRFKFGFYGLHLRDKNEMFKAFATQDEKFPDSRLLAQAFQNTHRIAEKVDLEIPTLEVKMPKIFEDEDKKLMEICTEGWKERVSPLPKSDHKKYKERFVHEMKLIKELGFVRYFLTVWDIVNFCHRQDIFVGPGRGSVGGSLVAYLMGLHQVDPIKLKLYFERFINPDRIDYPDIDLDFQHDRRDEVFKYVSKKYGKENVAHISTSQIMQRKMALRDVSRVFDIKPNAINYISKQVDNDIPLEEQTESNTDLKQFHKEHPEILGIAEKLNGQIRTKGVHPAGVIISQGGFDNRAVLELRSGTLTVNWNMNEVEQFGLIKIDILGLNNLTILANAAKNVWERKGEKVVYKEIVPNDPKVFEVFSKGHTTGVFQFEGGGITSVLKKLSPIEDFETIIHVNALYRPGPMGAGILDDYIDRKHGTYPRYLHKIQKEITQETFGCLIFQEQIMEVFHRIAGFTISEADTVRKIMGKSLGEKEFDKHRDHFVSGCKANGIDSMLAEELFNDLANFSKYAFNRSHAAFYSLIAYWTAYMKVYHPNEFMEALLSAKLGSDEATMTKVIEECRRLGIPVKTPDINKSGTRYTLVGDTIYTGLAQIKQVGEKAANAIIAAREKGFTDIWDLLSKVERRKVNSGVIKNLILAGAFEELHAEEGNRALLENIDTILKGKKDLKEYPEWDKKELLKKKASVLKGVFTVAMDDVKMKMKNPGKEIKTLKDELRKCTACQLTATQTKGPVPPEYTRNSKLFVVTEAPGQNEDRLSRPQIGQAGKKNMEYIMEFLGLKRSQLYITNVYNCWPGKGNKLPKDLENTCWEWLEKQLRIMQPTVILAQGNTPLQFFTGKTAGIQSLSGSYEYSAKYNAVVVFSVHPGSTLGYLSNAYENEQRLRKAMKTLRRFL